MANRDAKLIKRIIQDFSLNAGSGTNSEDLVVTCTYREGSQPEELLDTDKTLDEIARAFINGNKVTLLYKPSEDYKFVGEVFLVEKNSDRQKYEFGLDTIESPERRILMFNSEEQCFCVEREL